MADVTRTAFFVASMDCPAEERLIRNRLEPMPGVDKLEFDLMQRELVVFHRLQNEQPLLQALGAIGMDAATTPAQTASDGRETREHLDEPDRVPRLTWILMAIAGITAIGAEIVAWITGSESSLLVVALALISIVTGGKDTLRKGWIAMCNLTLNINFLMTVAAIGAIAIGQWPEAAMVIFLFGLAELIETLSLDRARSAIRGLMAISPDTATIKGQSGEWKEIQAGSVAVGAIARVKPGERIPLDGIVLSGRSSVNQAPITGENMPVEKQAGDPVFAGTINERGSFEFSVTANRGNTTLARIIRSVQEAQSQRAPTQRFVDQFSRYYTPAVVIFAVLVAVLPPLVFGAPFVPWLYKALVMLVIACPCALVISTPVTVVSGLAAAARRGILIKGGVYLENGRKIRAIALDKTGTVTHGRPVVTDTVVLSAQSSDRLLQVAASLEAHSEHPVAGALVAAWNRPKDLLSVSGFASTTGRGAKGYIEGGLYHIGNHRLTEELGVCTPRVEEALERLEREGKTAVVLSSQTQALAVFGVADTVRDTSIQAVKELHELGVASVMLTGDNQTTAFTIARQVGIDDVRGNLLPDDKLSAIEDLQRRFGFVGMVGDGINDAPALAKASIGFAMGAAGTDTALETADVALMQDDLRKLPEFLQLSRATSRVLRQNIALAIGIKAVFFVLALAGMATLWMAVFADMGASLLVVANGLRLLRYAPGEVEFATEAHAAS
ncbi:MAG TPA: heavy metal translocating P-type ATPase [Burkholderiales bacterium]|nr:heavy metal translocating P-type ATPase [Burkholderiales bacterium]